MRQGQQKRMRGRNRNGKGPNPLSRTYESNGPDVKVRGTPAHIAEKYIQLARDAQSSGDPILAESYLQHAEHYFRIIAAAQPQFNGQPGFGQMQDEDDDGEDLEFDGPVPSMPQGFASQINHNEEQPRFPQRDRGFGERERNFGERQSFNPERQPFNQERQPFGQERQPFNQERGEGEGQSNERFRDRGNRFNNDRGPREDRPPREDRAPREDRPPREDRAPREDRQPREDRAPREERVMRDDRPPRPERSFEGQPNAARGGETEGGGEGEQQRGFVPRGNRRDRRFGSDRPFQERGQGDRPFTERAPGERPTYHERSFAPAPQPVVPLDQPQPDVSDDRALSTLPSFITGAPVVTAPAPTPAPVPVVAVAPPAPPAAEPPSEGEGEARFPLRTRRRRTTKRLATAEETPEGGQTEDVGGEG